METHLFLYISIIEDILEVIIMKMLEIKKLYKDYGNHIAVAFNIMMASIIKNKSVFTLVSSNMTLPIFMLSGILVLSIFFSLLGIFFTRNKMVLVKQNG